MDSVYRSLSKKLKFVMDYTEFDTQSSYWAGQQINTGLVWLVFAISV
ncbi:hypothetical protein N474_01500 [Pseudoalteromonas luteoviolacea CPMOR-2]|nr:hypothetical protein N474_01500 [Pseudoalteromonas luteoviolacea CPMOR-2]